MKDDPRCIKGAAWALGITIHEVGRAWAISNEDFRRLAKLYLNRPPLKRDTSRKALANA